MQSFAEARKGHASVDDAARKNLSAASILWNAIAFGTMPDSKSGAVLEVCPGEYSAVVRSDEIAAVYAFSRLWAAFSSDEYSSAYAMREAFRNGWNAFAAQTKSADEMAEGFGWDRSEAWQSYREVISSDIDTAAVSRIAKLAARMYREMTGSDVNRIKNVPAEICDVTLGSDISRMIAGELAWLGVPVLCDVQFERIVTGKATIYKTQGQDKRAKGPLVMLSDESGSMHGLRREWAAAAMLALARVAKDEHRKAAVVHFSTSVVVQDVDVQNAADVAKLIKSHLSGGTDIARALRAGLVKVQELRTKVGQLADVILITDGIDGGQDIPAAVDSLVKECRLWTVAIDCDIPATDILRAKATEYIHLTKKTLDANSAISLVKAAK